MNTFINKVLLNKHKEGFGIRDISLKPEDTTFEDLNGIGDKSSKITAETLKQAIIDAENEGANVEGCDGLLDYMKNEGMKKVLEEGNKSALFYSNLETGGDSGCFKRVLKNKKEEIIKSVDILEINNKNKKKIFFSNLLGMDVRLEYLKNLNSTISNIQEEIDKNDPNNNEIENDTLNNKEKNDINKRLALFYNKNLNFLNIIYKIFYYLYLSLFLIYFLLTCLNLYMYKYKGETAYLKKLKFTSLGTLLIIILPILLNSLFSKYMFF